MGAATPPNYLPTSQVTLLWSKFAKCRASLIAHWGWAHFCLGTCNASVMAFPHLNDLLRYYYSCCLEKQDQVTLYHIRAKYSGKFDVHFNLMEHASVVGIETLFANRCRYLMVPVILLTFIDITDVSAVWYGVIPIRFRGHIARNHPEKIPTKRAFIIFLKKK